ncbi:MAG: DUF1622 domain-containing protein [Methanomicrobiales archaeon]
MAVGMDSLAPVVQGAALILEICGAVLVMYGGVYAALGVIQREVLKRPITYQTLRWDFTTKIVFGLEFLIAADIINTILSPTIEELVVLGAVVIIRTVLGYFLEKETRKFMTEGVAETADGG